MKKIMIMLGCVAVLAFATSAFATEPCQGIECFQTADGIASQSGPYGHGDDTNGGWAGSSTSGSFLANGINDASGSANAWGTPQGESSPGEAFSAVYAGSNATAVGDLSIAANVVGESAQANWASTYQDDQNFANGGNTTMGAYYGDKSSECGDCLDEVGLSGGTSSVGNTSTGVFSDGLSNNSWAVTSGNSDASQSGDGNTLVAGNGGVSAMAFMANDSGYAGATGNATFCYEEQNPTAVSGWGFSATNQTATISPIQNGLSYNASSYSSSSAGTWGAEVPVQD